MPVKATYLIVAGGGAILLWSGLTGKSWSAVLRDIISGRNPSGAAASSTVLTSMFASTSGTAAGSGTEVSGNSSRAILQATAADAGWTGPQWTCLVNVENAEAGFSPSAINSGSGALGLAQALGHGTSGTAGTLGNEYGGFGLTTAQAVAANSGDASAQALWMCNYIKAIYGTPCAAWSHEQSDHWY